MPCEEKAEEKAEKKSPLGARASLPCEEKSGEKIEEVISRPYVSDEGLFFVAPATPAGTPSRRQPGETVKALRGRPGRAGCGLPGAPKLPNRGAFVLSKRAAQDARALWADELRPRRREGASFSQIRCRNGRLVRRGCERVAPPRTAARTAAPAIPVTDSQCCPRSPAIARLSCRKRTIARYCAFPGFLAAFPAHDGPLLPAFAHDGPLDCLPLSKCPCTVRRSRSASRRAPFAAAPVALRAASRAAANAKGTHAEKGERSILHKQGNFLYCVDTCTTLR